MKEEEGLVTRRKSSSTQVIIQGKHPMKAHKRFLCARPLSSFFRRRRKREEKVFQQTFLLLLLQSIASASGVPIFFPSLSFLCILSLALSLSLAELNSIAHIFLPGFPSNLFISRRRQDNDQHHQAYLSFCLFIVVVVFYTLTAKALPCLGKKGRKAPKDTDSDSLFMLKSGYVFQCVCVWCLFKTVLAL